MRPSALPPILALAAALGAAGCAPRAPEAAPPAEPLALELRLADTVPRAGWTAFGLPGEPVPLFLAPEAVVGADDLDEVAAEATPDGVRLDLRLEPAAAERLARITGENVGRRIAVVVDGRVRGAARVAQSIGAGGVPLQVQLRMEPEEAERLRRRVEAEWPAPGPQERARRT